jgi:hypothetical protein
MIGTSVRVGQDIAFPRQTVFPHDTSYSGGNRGLMLRRRGVGRPYGVPGAQVAGEKPGTEPCSSSSRWRRLMLAVSSAGRDR